MTVSPKQRPHRDPRDPDILNEDPAERAEREAWEDEHDGTTGAHNDPGAPFRHGDY